jgi:predicted RND superfamily exporter protein
MASGIQFFVIDDDVMKMLPKNLESRVSWDALQDEFGSTEMIFIAFGHKSKSIFTPEAFTAAWDLSEQLETSQKVEEVTSVSRVTRMDNIDGFMEIDDLQPDRELSQEDVDNIKDYLDRNKTIKTRLVSVKDEYLVLMVQPYDTKGLDVFRNEVVAITGPILKGYEIHYGGNAYVTGTMPEMIREDVQGLMKIGLLIMVSILLLNLRSPKGVALVVMVIGLSLLAMMGFMGWIYRLTGSDRFLFTMANTSMPIILLTIIYCFQSNVNGMALSKYMDAVR